MPAISRSVDGLVQRGLVTRAENTEDRRMKTLQVTDAGRELLERLMELRFAGVEEFVGTLTPEERTNLADALDPIVSREDVAASSNAPSLSPRKDSNA
jgi:MarR family 2-MHQ and catechol resistance regulon transcriptional repressor